MEDVWWEGYRHFLNDGSSLDNPYYSETKEYQEWKEGYWQAAQDS